MENKKRFGELLRGLRRESGYSRRKLGYKIDRSESTIRNWENGEDFPNLDSLNALYREFGQEILLAAFQDYDAYQAAGSASSGPAGTPP